jgi:MoaA/NifB/PqqE/SkfB family radical SAM enzyme
MLEFLPWSRRTLDDTLDHYSKTREFSIIDIELGGACNLKCMYCDTPRYSQEIQYDTKELGRYIEKNKFSWLFICGLGEPTVPRNIDDLIYFLQICKDKHIKCTMFTNGVELTKELLSYIDDEVLYPLFKLDSLKIESTREIYGIKDEIILKKQIDNINTLKDHVKLKGNYTNICASIVPTTKNEDELFDIVQWCYDNNIFPLIGDLEDAGKGMSLMKSLKVSDEKLLKLKSFIKNKTGYEYKIPICPSVLCGVHIDHTGNIVVDKKSGLSCHWFWLTEPQIHNLGIFSDKEIETNVAIIEYRKKYIKEVEKLHSLTSSLVFGGCGGDIKELLSIYLERMYDKGE